MAIQDRSTLKGYFAKGKIPTGGQFADLIDSQLSLSEDGVVKEAKKALRLLPQGSEAKKPLLLFSSDDGAQPDWVIGLEKLGGDSSSSLCIGNGRSKIFLGAGANGDEVHIESTLQLNVAVNPCLIQRKKDEPGRGSRIFLELYQDDDSKAGEDTLPCVRFHHGGHLWRRIEAQRDGFHFKDGDLRSDAYCDISANRLNVHGLVSFGAKMRQMINLWEHVGHGIGVQDSTTYFRTYKHFGFYAGGDHDDGALAPGGGKTLMSLSVGEGAAIADGLKVNGPVRVNANDRRQLSSNDWVDVSGNSSGIGLFGGNVYVKYEAGSGDRFCYANGHHKIGAIGFAVNYPEWNSASVIASGTTEAGQDKPFDPKLLAVFRSDGSMGLGTSSPGARLSVVAPGQSELLEEVHSRIFLLSGGVLPVQKGNENELILASFGFKSANHSFLNIRARRNDDGGDWNTSAIGLCMDVDRTRCAGASIWITRGAVGIGTENPAAKLDVAGDLRVAGGLQIVGTSLKLGKWEWRDEGNVLRLYHDGKPVKGGIVLNPVEIG